jgi:hypothetical protein
MDQKSSIGLKATKDGGAAGVATITRISFSEDDEGPPEARVSVRYGPEPKRDKKGMAIGPWPESSDLRVPASVARRLTVGQKCRIVLKPVAGGRYEKADRSPKLDGITERVGL